ncbi:MAG TPA: AMP-binding protein [Planctomycetaceae bacterium]|jgi:acyl-coenzyme A synthetase/AMP-(fatty) acid ligase
MSFDYSRVWSNWDPWRSIPAEYNLGEALTRGQVQADRGDVVALHWENAAGASRAWTYRQLDVATSRLASSLARLGLKFGDRVFLRLPNIPEFYIAALAVAKLGAVFIPSSTQFRASEVEYRLKDSGAVAAISTSGLVDAIDEAAANCPELKRIIVVAYPEPSPAGAALVSAAHIDFHQLVSAGNEAFDTVPTRHDDVAFIAYTSGTTGDPKGVVHYQRYPIAYEGLVRYWHDYRPDDVVACPSELGWLLPIASTFLYALSRGLQVVLYDPLGGKFDPERWFALFEKYRITNFTAPPTTYRMMTAAGSAATRFDLSHWRHAVSAGEPLPADTLNTIHRQFGVMPIDGIGMTECMVYCFNYVGMPFKPGSCGRPGPGTVIELLDDELRPVADGTEGVLCLKRDTHPGMMKEYWNKPEATAQIFRGEWYCSGDVLVRDEDGYFWFKGRNDDVIKASGYRISPFEVESGVVSHPAVLEAAAVESPDPIRGMVVKAFVVLRDGHLPSDELAEQIQEQVKRTIAPYKYPRRIEFVAALPKTPSGKIKRRELRELEQTRNGEPGT